MTRTKLGVVTLALLLAAACDSRITGNEGNFEFSYPADDRVFDFNKPVAVGAWLDLEVRDVGSRQPVDLTDASFDDPAVLDVVDFDGPNLTINGTGDGGALLSVTGVTAGGETLTDSVNMLARVPEVLNLSHTCGSEGTTAPYLADQTVWVPFEMEMSNGQPVIGYGYYPVTLSGTGLGTLDDTQSGQQFMAFELGTTTGALTLDSDLDDHTLTIQIVNAADIDGVADPVALVVEDIDVGDTNSFYVLPEYEGDAICQADVTMTVTSDTPTICTVTRSEPDVTGDRGQYEYGWFTVTGVAEGTCTYTVTYPAGDGGNGVSAQFTYPIEP